MKTLLSIALLCIASVLFAQEEYTTDYKVQYELTYHADSLNLDASQSEFLYLFSGSKQSVYTNHNIAFQEEIEKNMKLQKASGQGYVDWNKASGQDTNFEDTYYKNLEEDKVYVSREMLEKQYGYLEPNIPIKWNLTEDSKEFLGYTVQKATTYFAGRSYIAWFTLEIPLNDGPYVFYGLPGLIVELYDEKKHYHFKMQSIEKLEKSKVWIIPEYNKVSKEEFRKLVIKQIDAEESEFLRGISEGWAMMLDDNENVLSESEVRRHYRKQKERKNNPIELE